jgi:hypothetical protein
MQRFPSLYIAHVHSVSPDVVPSGGNHIRVQQVYAVKPLY